MSVTPEFLFGPQLNVRSLEESIWEYLALTLKMNVLMLMYFPIHVGVSVCVNVCVDFGVDFSGNCWSSLTEEELLLLLREVLLIVHGCHTVFLGAGGAGRGSRAAPVPLPVRQPLRALQYLRGRGAGRRTVFSALAEPQQHYAKDEHYYCRDANDDRPGEGAGGLRKHRCYVRLSVCKRK